MIFELTKLKATAILKEIKTEGHSPLLLIAEDGYEYFVKNTRGRIPDYSMINELMCSFFLKQWKIPTSKLTIINIDKNLLKSRNFSHHHKPYFYDIPAVGSRRIENATEINQLISINGKIDYNKYANPIDILKIALFDIWVDNSDRKPTNPNLLIQSTKSGNRIVAIDHAFTFAELNYASLNPEHISNTYNESLLATKLARYTFKLIKNKTNWTNEIRKYFYFCVSECEKHFERYAITIPKEFGFTPDLQKHVSRFLFSTQRKSIVFQEFLTRIAYKS